MTEDRQRRRVGTMVAADVFGYSRLTAENEEDALRTLKAHRAVIDRLIARHDGRIFNTAGDSVLAEYRLNRGRYAAKRDHRNQDSIFLSSLGR